MGGGMGVGEIVKTVVGAAGTAASVYGAVSQGEYLNEQLGVGRQTVALQEGLAQYFLGGGKASKLDIPGFQDQFGEIDFALQEQSRLIDTEARKAQQMISENIPAGGAKLRALANLSIKTQDAKGKAVRESQSRKRDLDVQLTNQYTQASINRNFGPSQDARLWSAQKDYDNTVRNFGAISGALGSLTEKAFPGEKPDPGITYTPQKAVEPMAYQTDLLADVRRRKERELQGVQRKLPGLNVSGTNY